MKIQELYDIDKDIKVNDFKEVKSQAIYKSQGMFNPDGLFSEEIFGQTDAERDYTCAYIKLPVYVFNPMIANNIIKRAGGIIRKMAYGEVRCNIVDKVLVASPEGQYCGMVDLYNIWEKIDITKTLKNTRSQENIDILTKSPKRLIFNNKVLVLPPGVRKIGTRNGKMVKSELNTIYMSIFGLKRIYDLTSHTTESVHQIRNKFQEVVISLYQYIATFLKSKTGFLQQSLMAKNTFWTVRNVISAPKYNTEKSPIGVFQTGFPLDSLTSMFDPMVRFHMKHFLSYNNLLQIHPNKNEIKAVDIENIYDNKAINDILAQFRKNMGSRFNILYLDAEKTKPIIFDAFDVEKNEVISRPLTVTDVVFLCCQYAIVDANRMVYTVRYPIGDYMGSFFSKVHILSTVHTKKIQFNGRVYEYYPIIDTSLSHSIVATQFASTINPSNSRLKAIGGDYDGDTVKSVGIWSDEANKKAEELMYSKICNITPQGTTIYDIAIECLNGLYALTKTS